MAPAASTKATKRGMAESSSSSSSSAEIAKQIQSLLKESSSSGNERTDAARLDELRKIYARLIQSGDFSLAFAGSRNTTKSSSSLKKWQAFLSNNHQRLVEQLCRRIAAGKRTAIRTLWGVVATTPVTSTAGTHQLVSTQLLLHWIRAMSHWPGAGASAASMDRQVRHMVQAEFWQPYRDVQYYSMIAIRQCATELYQQHQQQQQKKRKQPKQDDTSCTSSDNDDDSDNEQETAASMPIEERAQRLVELLMMVPIPSTQAELDRDSGGALFSPPENAIADEDDDSSTNASDDDDDDDDEVSDYDDDDEAQGVQRPATKRAKRLDGAAGVPTRKKRHSNSTTFAYCQVRRHHAVWGKAWMAVLRLPLPAPTLKRVLRFVPPKVLGVVPDPVRFADFFMQAYSSSSSSSSSSESDNNKNNNNTQAAAGVIPILALDGLFLLMTQHGLEYPNFYKQLYRLITPAVWHVKYQTTFFRLLAACLTRNEMLPAHLVAAFCKRLLRCTLTAAPPASALQVLALASNLIRTHGEIACLVHRNSNSNIKNSNNSNRFQDQFDAETNDPELAGALQSSLWELVALERHYYPAVQTMAKSVGLAALSDNNSSTPLYNLQDEFVGHTYQSLFEQERKRKPKRPRTSAKGSSGKTSATVPLTFQEPETLFSSSDDMLGDILAVRSE